MKHHQTVASNANIVQQLSEPADSRTTRVRHRLRFSTLPLLVRERAKSMPKRSSCASASVPTATTSPSLCPGCRRVSTRSHGQRTLHNPRRRSLAVRSHVRKLPLANLRTFLALCTHDSHRHLEGHSDSPQDIYTSVRPAAERLKQSPGYKKRFCRTSSCASRGLQESQLELRAKHPTCTATPTLRSRWERVDCPSSTIAHVFLFAGRGHRPFSEESEQLLPTATATHPDLTAGTPLPPHPSWLHPTSSKRRSTPIRPRLHLKKQLHRL